MSIYVRNCDYCGKHYKGRGDKFCSRDCSQSFHKGKEKQEVHNRFWAKVNIRDLLDCWEWTACKDSDGYGNFRIKGKGKQSHRVAWEFYYGEIPKGMQINHKCNNPSCCNISHLYLETPQDNMDDMIRAGRQKFLKGENCGRAKLTEKQVIEILIMIKRGDKDKEIAKGYEVTVDNIGFIRRRKSWKHIHI